MWLGIFSTKLKYIFKEIILEDPFGENKNMLFLLNLKIEVAHMSIHSYEFSMHQKLKMRLPTYSSLRKEIGQFPDQVNDPRLFEIVKTHQVHAHSRTCLKYNKNECCFSFDGSYFTEKTIFAKPLDSKFTNEEKKEILMWRNKLL